MFRYPWRYIPGQGCFHEKRWLHFDFALWRQELSHENPPVYRQRKVRLYRTLPLQNRHGINRVPLWSKEVIKVRHIFETISFEANSFNFQVVQRNHSNATSASAFEVAWKSRSFRSSLCTNDLREQRSPNYCAIHTNGSKLQHPWWQSKIFSKTKWQTYLMTFPTSGLLYSRLQDAGPCSHHQQQGLPVSWTKQNRKWSWCCKSHENIGRHWDPSFWRENVWKPHQNSNDGLDSEVRIIVVSFVFDWSCQCMLSGLPVLQFTKMQLAVWLSSCLMARTVEPFMEWITLLCFCTTSWIVSATKIVRILRENWRWSYKTRVGVAWNSTNTIMSFCLANNRMSITQICSWLDPLLRTLFQPDTKRMALGTFR